MKQQTSSLLILASLAAVLIVAVACTPVAAPVPPAATPANAITNIVWQWTNVTSRPAGATTAVPNPQAYTITFRDDGTLSGQADCNAFTGTYSQEGGFAISLGASTMAACGDDSLDQQYLQLLDAVAAGGPDGTGNLALETAGGEQRMLFVDGGAAPAP
jgi:heat shock protein HslJ